ncbi:hypothetical protein C9374_003487 [Naegleria lovaniensis]|uniref:RGS domain-containing protein n=1 Tax=Naegleria lovaniensis TaxID=51637 RepID=A0AA88GMZ8_NAELO|nr:uncharacterized protein C9374_003487 [Naegleria lovaniensis]KAG2385672.1 hypothetical protein C9374_003487 [Naegleria lovaniensis]
MDSQVVITPISSSCDCHDTLVDNMVNNDTILISDISMNDDMMIQTFLSNSSSDEKNNLSSTTTFRPKHISLTSNPSSTCHFTSPSKASLSSSLIRHSSLQDCNNNNNKKHRSTTSTTLDDSSSESANSIQSKHSSQLGENVKVEMEILDSMIVHPSGHSVLQLSAKHRVLLVFIKWFGCPMCQNVIDELQKYLSSFLLLNIIPVVCHQEHVDKFSKYISHTQIMHCSITNDIKKAFLVQRASLLRHAMMMPTLFSYMIKHRKKFFLPSRKEMKHMDMLSSFGMYMVFKGEVCHSFSSEKLNERPDYGSYIFQLEEEELLFKEYSQTPEEFIPDLVKLFPTMKEILRQVRMEKRKSVTHAMIQNVMNPTTFHNPTSDENDSLTVTTVLENASMRRFFKAFLANSFCLESVIFYEQVMQYKMLCQQEQHVANMQCKLTNSSYYSSPGTMSVLSDVENFLELQQGIEQKAKYIIETFLEDHSMFLINTSKKIISKMKTSMEECGYTETLFDEIVKDLIQQVLVYNFEEFTASKIFEDMKSRLINNKVH